MTEVPNSPAAVERARLEREEAGKQLMVSGTAPFSTNIAVSKAEPLAKQLFSTKDASEAHLAAVLFVISTHRSWMDAGFESFRDYVESRVGIDGSRANALVSHWEAFNEVELTPAALTSISWGKFRELVPAIKAGTINRDNIAEWLPYLATTGKFALPPAGLQRLVRAAMADKKAQDAPEEKTRLSIEVDAGDRSDIVNYINTVADKTGVSSAGEIIKTALARQVTSIVSDTDDLSINRSLSNLKEMAENMAPGTRVIFLAPDDNKNFNEHTLGVVPYTSIYTTPDRQKFALAQSEEEARIILKSKTVERHPILTSSIIDDMPQEDMDEDEDEEELDEPTGVLAEARSASLFDEDDDLEYVEVEDVEEVKPTQTKKSGEYVFKVTHITLTNTAVGARLPNEDSPLPLLPTNSKFDKALYVKKRKGELMQFLNCSDDQLSCLFPNDYLDFPPYPMLMMDAARYEKSVTPPRTAREDAEVVLAKRRDEMWKAACLRVLALKQSVNPPDCDFDEMVKINTLATLAKNQITPGVEVIMN